MALFRPSKYNFTLLYAKKAVNKIQQFFTPSPDPRMKRKDGSYYFNDKKHFLNFTQPEHEELTDVINYLSSFDVTLSFYATNRNLARIKDKEWLAKRNYAFYYSFGLYKFIKNATVGSQIRKYSYDAAQYKTLHAELKEHRTDFKQPVYRRFLKTLDSLIETSDQLVNLNENYLAYLNCLGEYYFNSDIKDVSKPVKNTEDILAKWRKELSQE